jgi:hypothetical protein
VAFVTVILTRIDFTFRLTFKPVARTVGAIFWTTFV